VGIHNLIFRVGGAGEQVELSFDLIGLLISIEKKKLKL
jgi:hypothetical protein